MPYYTTFLEYRLPCLLSLLTTPAMTYFPSCSVNLRGSPSAGEFLSVEVLREHWKAVIYLYNFVFFLCQHSLGFTGSKPVFKFPSLLVKIKMWGFDFLYSRPREDTPPTFCIPGLEFWFIMSQMDFWLLALWRKLKALCQGCGFTWVCYSLSRVWFIVTPWTIAHQASLEFSAIIQARILEWVAIPFSRGIFLLQGLKPGLLHCRQILYHGFTLSSKIYIQV